MRLQITGFHSINALVVIHLVHLFADFLHQCHHLFFLAEQEGEEKEEKKKREHLQFLRMGSGNGCDSAMLIRQTQRARRTRPC